MFGFINLNKPYGWTSHDCVAKVRRILKTKKVGHGGTLDPAATGVLPIAVGKATRLLSFLPEKKGYKAKIRFGVQTNTDDLEGEVIQSQNASELTLAQVQPLLEQFIGEIEQIPPAFSAIQQGGKRLYELARKGEVVQVPKRIVNIHQIEVLNWQTGEFPELTLTITCGGGTYIRAIARDLGYLLNVGGTLAALQRTESCGMTLAESMTLEQLESHSSQAAFSLICPDLPLQNLKSVTLSPTEAQRWCQGQKIPLDLALTKSEEAPAFQAGVSLTALAVRVYQAETAFLGIGELENSGEVQVLSPKVVLI